MSGRHYKSEEFTAAQLRSYRSLADAIETSLGAGQLVPCCALPSLFDATAHTTGRQELFDNEEKVRARLCRGCPALPACRVYATSGIEISGFVAGGRQRRDPAATHDVREAS